MLELTAFKWVPPFAQGHVRDYRVRWALEEVGLPYRVRLIDNADQRSPAYRAQQPFGQVPILIDDEVLLFETGAILLHIAEKTGCLLPVDPQPRATALSWLFAALSSIEPFVANLAEIDYFMADETQKALRRPGVIDALRDRLAKAEVALGPDEWLAGDFSIADLMLASVLRNVDSDGLIEACPRLHAHRESCLARPAYHRAIDGQMADFARHDAADMKWPAG